MKIALINENSQAGKNGLIEDILKSVVEPMGHKVYNYGRFSENDGNQRTYVQVGLLTAILLNSGAADFVITGCGTGMGAMLACNAFPNVFCGFVENPLDGYLFSQINAGNAIAMPFAKGFGWGSEINLKYMFERLFEEEPGGGFPKEWAPAEQRNKKILEGVKKVTCKDMITILEEIDRDFLLETIKPEPFNKYFFENCKNDAIKDYIKNLSK
ncbi:MAG: RpiB/LacA/LacB family sugar-phosphate isomerase [Clostridium sp.]|uniref:RpiB/LacA/LacB family sugar-phosphate isomerase n=1 Tax=Clostridium sp. TaxID=1506 RepID=UPI002A87A3E4|nr:RpiB/LacA/LacB family sugar-phosphate isomerase [Clostridium sp.]MDY5096860.1 RpiB/LacA/LacB family sugar-phosphate isomerase [Clostridium sp.]